MASEVLKKQKRKLRQRHKLKQKASDKLRLSVHRTNKHMYAQIIDVKTGSVVMSASTLSVEKIKNGGNKDAASLIGQAIAKQASAQGISDVVFDRSGFFYHGRIKALADAARENGLNF